ncbi:protease 2 [Phoenix dactylifera]|uniref:Prolyl endopeptidase n=1 Tax=Phoenix dactylifera TaxID=42345 RepID=A0A8B8J4L4_PHODC|nr:protease 2 [Phoenix dactylifera]
MLRRRGLFPSFPLPIFSSLFFSSSSCCYSSCKRRLPSLPSQRPPVPKKIPFAASAHGRTWEDPYRWMSNTDDPDLLEHLNRENAYAEAFMADTRDLQRRLVAEMKGRMPPKLSTPPERWGPWLYYQYIPEGKEYPVLCRRRSHPDGFTKAFLNYMRGFGKEELLLDWNEVAEKYGYVHIGTCRISPDHKFLAYTLDTSGSELFVLQIKDLRTGDIIASPKVEGVVSLAWAKDCSCLLYTVCDETQRPNRVFCTKLGSDGADDLLFTENDASCCVDITSTNDGKFITINSNSRTSSEVYVIDAMNVKDGLWLVRKRVPGVQYFLEHHCCFFYILTNAPSGDIVSAVGSYYLARCRAEKSLLARWQAIVLPDEGITFQDMDIFHGYLVLFLHQKGIPLFCSINMPVDVNIKQAIKIEDLNPWFFPVPSSLCNIVPGSNHDFLSSTYRVVISSPVMPDIMVDYNMEKQTFTIVHQEEVVGFTKNTQANSSSENLLSNLFSIQSHSNQHLQNLEDSQKWNDLSVLFGCERREVISYDGVLVPLTILYSRQAKNTGPSPGLLHGYGAYGEVLDKSWCSDRISLLSRGWVLAYADVRGGGGDASWHQAGTRSCKLNSIKDFAACGMYLVNEGFVHKNRLGAVGCSAGGLLVGAAINMYPDLFCAAILKVPFLDICNTMLDRSLPLTILDYDEFGDPRNQADYETIHSYSPYDNISPCVCYPSVLVTASFLDSRVGVWEAAKWVAKVRGNTCPTCSYSVILKTNMSGGHFAEGGRFIHCDDAAFEYAFLIKAMGLLQDEKQA